MVVRNNTLIESTTVQTFDPNSSEAAELGALANAVQASAPQTPTTPTTPTAPTTGPTPPPTLPADAFSTVTKNGVTQLPPTSPPPPPAKGKGSDIDAAIDAFAAANAGNPLIAPAMSQAVVDIKADPTKFINPDRSLNETAIKDAITKAFVFAGPVTLPALGLIEQFNDAKLHKGAQHKGPEHKHHEKKRNEMPLNGSGDTDGQTITIAGSRTYPNLGSLGQCDIMAICFVVMMEATKSANADLQSIMDGVKDINKQKDGWRTLQDTINKGCAALAGQNAGDVPNWGALNKALGTQVAKHGKDLNKSGFGQDIGQATYVSCDSKKMVYNFNTPGENGTVIKDGLVIEGQPPTVQNWLDAKDTIKNKLDSLSELGETESLRLQMAMDRVSKFMETLSNIEKKMSDTDSAVIQNQK